MFPRDLNNALQARLSEWGLSQKDVPELAALVRQYLSGERSRETLIAGLKRILWPHMGRVPRRGARGGYEHIGSPDDRLAFLLEDLTAVIDSAKTSE